MQNEGQVNKKQVKRDRHWSLDDKSTAWRQSNIKTSRPYILFTHSLKHEQHVTEETAALVHSVPVSRQSQVTVGICIKKAWFRSTT